MTRSWSRSEAVDFLLTEPRSFDVVPVPCFVLLSCFGVVFLPALRTHSTVQVIIRIIRDHDMHIDPYR